MRQLVFPGVLLACVLAGCGGGSGNSTSDKKPDFSLVAAPSTVSVTPGGEAQSIAVIASAVNGFTGDVTVTVGSLPTGVTATPSSLHVAAASQGQIRIAASASAVPGTTSVSLTGASTNALSHNAVTALTVNSPVTTASLSSTAFDFGGNLVNNTVTQSVVMVTNTGLANLTMTPTLSGDTSYSVATGMSCGQQLEPRATCNVVVNYTPTTASAPATQSATLNMGFGDVPANTPQTVAITGTAAALPVGQVVETNNPQVARYTMTLPFPGSITVSFGKDTNYGLKTWSQSTPVAGGTVSIFVAGMEGATTYHMQATVAFANGITASDTDHTFTTKDVPANMKLLSTTATTAGMTPQPGLELLNLVAPSPNGIVITDLSGTVLWTYANPGNLNITNGVKVLPNGNFLMAIGAPVQGPILSMPVPAGTISEIREVNLAGDTVREISVDDLNVSLASATCAECNVRLATFHHDVEPLPNGHWLVLANTTMALSATSVPPLTNIVATTVLGDVIVDLDQNLKPVWVWNEFNHLDPNRHPFMFPDWTHTNAVVYSKDDGNILVSLRHQNWVLKVHYADGAGDGSILWRLGQGGDFTLIGGTDPTDWAYAQHFPAFFSPSTSGVFSLGVMDNGDDRAFPSGVSCGSSGAPPCLYTTIPVWQIDEGAKTATFTFHQTLPTNLYSFFGGNVGLLANGNVEYALSGVGSGSYVFEVTHESIPQTVWNMQVSGTLLTGPFASRASIQGCNGKAVTLGGFVYPQVKNGALA